MSQLSDIKAKWNELLKNPEFGHWTLFQTLGDYLNSLTEPSIDEQLEAARLEERRNLVHQISFEIIKAPADQRYESGYNDAIKTVLDIIEPPKPTAEDIILTAITVYDETRASAVWSRIEESKAIAEELRRSGLLNEGTS